MSKAKPAILSFGLIALVAILALTLGIIGAATVAVSLPPAGQDCSAVCGPNCPCGDNCQCVPGACVCRPQLAMTVLPKNLVQAKSKFEELHGDVPLPQVNHSALSELKQQCPGGNCYRQPTYYYPSPIIQPAVTQPIYAPRSQLDMAIAQYGASVLLHNGKMHASLPHGYVWVATGNRGTHAFTNVQQLLAEIRQGTRPVNVNSQTPQPTNLSATDQPVISGNRLQITLFVRPGDPRSEMLRTWFMAHPTLAHWRSHGTYQEYTPDNALYNTMRTRDGRTLRQAVPESAFPTVVFADERGGHIHAAGGDVLPDSPETLVEDVWKGMELKSTVPSGSGANHTGGYSWDKQSAGLSWDKQFNMTQYPYNPNPNCPDGNCPYDPNCPDGNCPYPPNDGGYDGGRTPGVDNSENWYPGKNIKDLLARPGKTGMVKDGLWGWLDIIVWGAVAVFAIVVGFVAFGFFCIVILVILWMVNRK